MRRDHTFGSPDAGVAAPALPVNSAPANTQQPTPNRVPISNDGDEPVGGQQKPAQRRGR